MDHMSTKCAEHSLVRSSLLYRVSHIPPFLTRFGAPTTAGCLSSLKLEIGSSIRTLMESAVVARSLLDAIRTALHSRIDGYFSRLALTDLSMLRSELQRLCDKLDGGINRTEALSRLVDSTCSSDFMYAFDRELDAIAAQSMRRLLSAALDASLCLQDTHRSLQVKIDLCIADSIREVSERESLKVSALSKINERIESALHRVLLEYDFVSQAVSEKSDEDLSALYHELNARIDGINTRLATLPHLPFKAHCVLLHLGTGDTDKSLMSACTVHLFSPAAVSAVTLPDKNVVHMGGVVPDVEDAIR
jgi:hypothetical protein